MFDKKNEDIELAFEDAASKLYRQFRITKCFLEDEKCLSALVNDLKGDTKGTFPKIVLSIKTHDFRSEFMGLRHPDTEITEESII